MISSRMMIEDTLRCCCTLIKEKFRIPVFWNGVPFEFGVKVPF